MRRISTLAGTAAVATLATVAFSPSAQAATVGSCNLVVPAQVRISSPFQQITASVTGTCTRYGSNFDAYWDAVGAASLSDSLWFNGPTTKWDVHSYTALGVRTWKPGDSIEWQTLQKFTQNAPKTDIRAGSWSSLRASRSGSKVTLSANGTRWSTSWEKPIAHQTTATIQYRNAGSSTWNTLKTQSVNGAFSYSYKTSATRDYRVTYNASKYIWAATSPTVRK